MVVYCFNYCLKLRLLVLEPTTVFLRFSFRNNAVSTLLIDITEEKVVSSYTVLSHREPMTREEVRIGGIDHRLHYADFLPESLIPEDDPAGYVPIFSPREIAVSILDLLEGIYDDVQVFTDFRKVGVDDVRSAG